MSRKVVAPTAVTGVDPHSQGGCCRGAARGPSANFAARSRRWIALLHSLLALACGSSAAEDPGRGPIDGSGGSDGGSECSGDFDVYEAGMSRQAEPGAITVELVQSEPAPPVVRTDNTWWLRLLDSEGEPLLGAQLLVTPFMPHHQHGSAEVVIEELGDGGYKLSPIDLFMPGVWEIPVSITPPDGETSEMRFRFCIAER